ncbi:uncharacterized protein BP5553_09423 [Venustampulla echinocandica]|uniref:Altered inheritance of mitochondria protein 6 n=1 Tax=Venustampulla echinocandica TaxID=2656787 RepID=A0A370TCR7_9HELO|nr:uncharacterized protein BP5553_09423 [Venustampulla echinocandica]RDL32021.1 hypothetical protein BP5553_09423 [Venustampulla echinocandica]
MDSRVDTSAKQPPTKDYELEVAIAGCSSSDSTESVHDNYDDRFDVDFKDTSSFGRRRHWWSRWLMRGRRPRIYSAGDGQIDAEKLKDDDVPLLVPESPQPPRKRKRPMAWYDCCIYGGVTGTGILAVLLLINLVLGATTVLQHSNIDTTLDNWGRPGSGTEGLAFYPTDFTRDITPIPCHSHNDYWRRVPLFSALRAGCTSVEADVWHFGDDLYVGHNTASLTQNRTFQSLYVNPLVDILHRQNPDTEFYNGTSHGVFDTDTEKTLTLLVDVKTSGPETWLWVLKQLEPLRERGWLSFVENSTVHIRPVTVVGTGETPFDVLIANSTYRDAFFDAPLETMWEDEENAPETTPIQRKGQGLAGTTEDSEFHALNSYYASVSFGKAIGTVWGWKLSPNQMKTIRGQLANWTEELYLGCVGGGRSGHLERRRSESGGQACLIFAMAELRDAMMGWVLGEIRSTNDEGISISRMFENLENRFTGHPEVKPFVWQSLVDHKDVVLGDGKAGLALRKLTLDDVLILGLGRSTIKIQPFPRDERPPQGQMNGDHATPTTAVITPPLPDQWPSNTTSTPAQEPGLSPKNSSGQIFEFTSAPTAIQPPKKRRGRPPKIKTKLLATTPVAPPINEAPRRRGRPPKSRQNLSTPGALSVANVEGYHGTSNYPAPNELTEATAEEYSSSFSARDSNSPTAVSGTLDSSADVADSALTPQTPRETRLRPIRATPQKSAHFTSWEDMQRHEGVAGVYNDHEAARKRRLKSIFCGSKSTVLVFKSGKLRDPQWLGTHMGSWVEPLATRMAESVIQQEDTAQTPSSKRKKVDDNVKSDEPMAEPKPKRKCQRKSAEPAGDVSTTIEPFGINEGQPASKRKRAGSIDQSPTRTEDTPSNKRARRSISLIAGVDSGPEQTAKLSGITPDTTIVQEYNPANNESEASTSQPPTLSSQGPEGGDSRYISSHTGADVERRLQFQPVQGNSALRPYTSIHQGQQPPEYGPHLRPSFVPNGAYYNPYLSSVTQPVSWDIQAQATNQNIRAYRSPYGAPTPEVANFRQSPVRSTSELWPSAMHDARPALANSVSPLGPTTPQIPISAPASVAHPQVDFTKHQNVTMSSQPHHETTASQPMDEAASKPMVDESGPRRGSFSSTNFISREEQAQFFSPRHVSPGQLSQRASSPNPNPQVENLSKHTAKPADVSKGSSNAEKDAQRNGIEAALLLAASTPIPSDVVRLAAVYKAAVGNLLLSADKSTVEFFGLDQFPPQVPKILLPISKMHSNPITSVSGSYPMEIRITANEDGITTTHCFQFASTPEAYEAASNMRAKLVTAKIAFQFRTGELYQMSAEAKEDITRPYKCDKCGNTFKNKGGLEYHVTRSQTTCNPSHDPSSIVKRRGRQIKKREQMATDSMSENGQSQFMQHKILQGQHEFRKATKRSDRASSDSDDSILEWAEQHATTGTKAVYRQPSIPASTQGLSKSKKPKVPLRSLAGEASMWQEIAQDIFPDTSIVERSHLDVANNQYFQQIILNLVHGNGGLFSGDKGLWFALVGAWLKRSDKSSNNIPESKFCRKAFEDLIDAGKLEVSSFSFRDKASRVITRKITTVPGFDLQSTQFELMKTAIQEAHPEFYIPAENSPPDTVLSRLQAIARRQIGTPNEVGDEMGVMDPNDPAHQQVSSPSDDEFITEDFSLEQEDSFEEDDGISDEDEFQPEVGRGKRRLKREHRPAQAMRKRWAAARASGLSSLAKNAAPIAPSWRRVAMAQVHKSQTARNTPVGLHGWILGTAVLPNPETGAWDQSPIYVKQRAPPTKRPRLPEPITYIQRSNGAWANRAFGHGVSPIFSRRPRGKEGFSPSANHYRRKIDNGFRPILYRGQDRQHLTVVPSRSSLASDTGISQSEAFSLDLEGAMELDQTELGLKKRGAVSQSLAEDEYSDSLRATIRMPKAAGRPARAYASRAPRQASTRRRSNLVGDDFDLEPVDFPRVAQPNRRTRTSLKAAEALDEIELLGSFKPKEPSIGAPINPGLMTLPSYFGLGRSIVQADEQQSAECFQSHQNLQFVDPNVISQSCDLGEGSWTCDGGSTTSQTIQLKWRDSAAFTVENLPYDELETETEEVEVPSQPRSRYQKKRRVESSFVSLNRKDAGGEKYSKSRPQTALPEDFEGVLEDPTQAASVFDVQVAKQLVGFHRAESRKMGGNMTPDLERRFVAAVITVQVLTGGLEGNIDWVLIANIFTEFSITFLTKTWGQLRTKMPDIVEHITEDFRDAFPEAYRRGEVPPINYDNLIDYDWNSVIDWVTRTINPTLDAQSVTLPADRRELKQQYHVTESVGDVNNWRDSFFGLTTAIYKRIDMAAAIPSTISIRRQQGSGKLDDIKLDDFTLAKSWVRAAAVTPEELWDQRVAAAKLSELGLPLVEKALQALLGAKVLVHRSKGRVTPGRSYEGSDAFAAPLRKHINNQQFIDALNFKKFLDDEFFQGKDRTVTVDYMANEGTLMCITSLQAHGRIELHGVDVPMNKFGLTGGGYETKKIPREKLRFTIDMNPTSSYVYNQDIELLRKAEQVEPLGAGSQGELPAWIGITGALIEDLWKRVVASISQVVTLRAGIPLDALKNVFAPTLEEWELKRFMEWGVELGIFERLHERIDGWTVSEWWWLAVAKLCER